MFRITVSDMKLKLEAAVREIIPHIKSLNDFDFIILEEIQNNIYDSYSRSKNAALISKVNNSKCLTEMLVEEIEDYNNQISVLQKD